jgi:hypothetical protein
MSKRKVESSEDEDFDVEASMRDLVGAHAQTPGRAPPAAASNDQPVGRFL